MTGTGLCSVLRAEPTYEVKWIAQPPSLDTFQKERGEFDLILIDLPLVGKPGFDFIEHIKSEAPRTKVVVYSERCKKDQLVAAISLGIDAFLMKSNPVLVLTSAVKTVLTGAKWSDLGGGMRTLFCSTMLEEDLLPEPTLEKKSFDSLSPREIQITSLIAYGLRNEQIASALSLTMETIKTHIRHIREKLDATSRTEVAVRAIKAGIAGSPFRENARKSLSFTIVAG